MAQPRTTIASLIAAAAATFMPYQPAEAASPSVTAEGFELMIDGETVQAERISGGGIRAAVETIAVDGALSKQVVDVVHSDVVIDLDLAAMPPQLAAWIRESSNGEVSYRTGAWIAPSADGAATTTREFFDAHITSIKFPTFDAKTKEPARVEVSLSPEFVETAPTPSFSAAPATTTQKTWQASNFRFELGDLPTARVEKIDEIVIKQEVNGDTSVVDVSNLRVWVPAAVSRPWLEWFSGFVIDGKCADGDELDGQITYLAPDLATVLGRLELNHVGIVSIEPDKEDSGSEDVAFMVVELYVEALCVELSQLD